MSRDETLQVLGELEQLSSDLCLSFLAVARTPQGREHLQGGLAQLAQTLRTGGNEIQVSAELAARAVLPIKRLLDFSAAQKQQVFGNNDA